MVNDGLRRLVKEHLSMGRICTKGSTIATFGLLCLLSFFVALAEITGLIHDREAYAWWFNRTSGLTILLAGSLLFVVGSALMLGDWKRKEPEPPGVPVSSTSTIDYDASHPRMEYHIET